MPNCRREAGFTLIELMVVVLIIGILVAIALPTYLGAADKSRLRTCLGNLRAIDGTVVTYYLETGVNPPDLSALPPLYFKRLPQCPHGASYVLVPGPDIVSEASCTAGHSYQ